MRRLSGRRTTRLSREPDVTTMTMTAALGNVRTVLALSASLMLVSAGGALAQAPDVAAAEALMKKSECFQCHAAARKKDGPSFKETVAKYKDKGRPEAESAIYKLLT